MGHLLLNRPIKAGLLIFIQNWKAYSHLNKNDDIDILTRATNIVMQPVIHGNTRWWTHLVIKTTRFLFNI